MTATYGASILDWGRIRARAREVASTTRRPVARHTVTEVDAADAARIAARAPMRRLGSAFSMALGANLMVGMISLFGVPIAAVVLVLLHGGDFFGWLLLVAACVFGGIGAVGFLIGLAMKPDTPSPRTVTREVVDDFWVLATHEREEVWRGPDLTRTTTNVVRYVLRRDGRLEVVMESWDEVRRASGTWTSPREKQRWTFTDDNALMFDYPHRRERIERPNTEITLWVKGAAPNVARKGDGLLARLDGLRS